MSMKNNQLNSSISNYYTTGDNDSMLALGDGNRNRASHSNNATRNSSSLFYRFLKNQQYNARLYLIYAILIAVSALLITIFVGLVFYYKDIHSAILIGLLLIVNFTYFMNLRNK